VNPYIAAKTVYHLLSKGETRELIKHFKKHLYSVGSSLVLMRDLAVPHEPPQARVPITIRPMHPKDLEAVIAERPRRLPVIADEIPTCYVAVTGDGSICYMQWLIGAENMHRLAPYFSGSVPNLRRNEMMLEFAFTFPRYRGLRIMPAAMSVIAEKAADHDARYVVTYVKSDNIPALKGCERAGFKVISVRKENWTIFKYTESVFPSSTNMSQ